MKAKLALLSALLLGGCSVTGGIQWNSPDGTSSAALGFSQEIKLPSPKGLDKNQKLTHIPKL